MAWTADEIATERLLLRCLTRDDWPVLERILTNVAVREFLGGPVSGELLTKLSTSDLGDQQGAFAVVAGTTMVGMVNIEHERDDRELSYQFLPEHWGNGYAEEASRAVLDWAWQTTDSLSLIAVTQSANARSLGLLDRLGFVFEKTFVEYNADQTQVRLARPDKMIQADHPRLTGKSQKMRTRHLRPVVSMPIAIAGYVLVPAALRATVSSAGQTEYEQV